MILWEFGGLSLHTKILSQEVFFFFFFFHFIDTATTKNRSSFSVHTSTLLFCRFLNQYYYFNKMPSGIRRRAAMRAGRDLHVNKRDVARKRAARKERQLRRALSANPVVAASWNAKETLAQNYRRLGLRAKLNGVAGGQEREFTTGEVQVWEKDEKTVRDPLLISNGGHLGAAVTKKEALGANEARIERDADGNVVRIVYGEARAYDESDDEEFSGFADSAADENKTEVVKELERLASLPVVSTPRVQSARENDWIGDLVEKYGDDFDAMVRDRKLNPFQQTAGDLRRRVKKWKKENNIA